MYIHDTTGPAAAHVSSPFVQVTIYPRERGASVALELVRHVIAFDDAKAAGKDPSSAVDAMVAKFEIHRELAAAVLGGSIKAEVMDDALVMHVPQELYQRLAADDRPEDAPSFESATVRVERVQRVLSLAPGATSRDAARRLEEVLCDLRYWAEHHGLDFNRCLDLSFEKYMVERFQSLTSN